MFSFVSNPLLLLLITFVLSLVTTYLVRGTATKIGFVAKPKADRWHQKPTALMGGVGIYAATLIAVLLFLPLTTEILVVLGASSLMFVVGLIDDVYNIKPYQKLVGQLIGAGIIVSFGLQLRWTEYEVINIFVTIFWLIGITNATNLLDNMDGLSAGIVMIAAVTVGAILYANGQTEALPLIAVFVGALLGFLRYNFHPASIFMGDSGSLFIGFFLASSVLLTQTYAQSRSLFTVLAVPVLTLFVPIFDTTFVTILRKMWGRKASQGGRDHTSHRLVALGLSERSAVLMLYSFAALAGVLALSVRELRLDQSVALISLFVITLTIIGVYLGNVKVYKEQEEALEAKAIFGFLVDISYKRRIFEVLLDVFLITLAYYAAYAILFDSLKTSGNLDLFLKSLPILVVLKLAAFLIAGVYRGLWRYTSVKDLVTFSKAVALGSVLSVLALVLIYRFESFSRTVFVLDAVLLLAALGASRMAFRFFRQVLPRPENGEGRKVLIFGAGDGGELALREIYNNPELKYNPIGFVDDDPRKKGIKIHGLRVLGGNGSIPAICEQYNIEEILISSKRIKTERLRELRDECESVAVELKRTAFRVEPLDEFFD